jgi:DNA-binding GntR family transcriptional regulator
LLRERIIEMRYPPGALLSQRRLAEELSISRGAVAEALRILHREGLVTIAPPGRGMRVAAGDRSMLMSAYAVREVIDGLAARLAARHAGPGLDATLRRSIEEQAEAAEAGDRRRYARANVAFHGSIIEASGNHLLLTHLTLVRSTVRSAGVVALQRLHEAAEEHETIVSALAAHDAEWAEDAARSHVRATIEALELLSNGHRSAVDA